MQMTEFPQASIRAGMDALDKLWHERCKEYLGTGMLEDIVCAVLDAAERSAWRPIEEAPTNLGPIWVACSWCMRLAFWDGDHWEDYERRCNIGFFFEPKWFKELPCLPKHDEVSKESRLEKLEAALLSIELMDVYTREGEDPAHEVMRKIAREARES